MHARYSDRFGIGARRLEGLASREVTEVLDLALRAKWTLKGSALTILAGTVPFLSFYSERNATRKTRAGERV